MSSYDLFTPTDILYNGSVIKILAKTTKYWPNTGVPKTTIVLIELNPTTFAYQINELFDSAHLSTVFDAVSFIRTFHYGTLMQGNNLAISGIVTDPSNHFKRSFIYEKNSLGVEYFKTFLLNNQDTYGFQVNGYHADASITFCMSNFGNNIAIHKPMDLYNTTSSYTQFYLNNDNNLWITNHGHGMKLSSNFNDFFVGQYNLNSQPPLGYAYIRYDNNSGLVNQNFYYNISLDDYSPIRSFYDYYSDNSAFVSSGLQYSNSIPYIYLINKQLSGLQDNCSYNFPLEITTRGRLTETNETMTTDTILSLNSDIIDVLVNDVLTELVQPCNDNFSGEGLLLRDPGLEPIKNSEADRIIGKKNYNYQPR